MNESNILYAVINDNADGIHGGGPRATPGAGAGDTPVE